MKKMFFLLFPLLVSGAENGLLLDSNFNKFTTIPEWTANSVTKTGGIDPELQLRMYKGPAGRDNAVELNNKEFISYTGEGNFDPECGSVSFWVKPVNWKMHDGGKYYHKMFTLRRQNVYFLRLLREGTSNLLSLYYGGGRVYASPKWNPGEWHKIDFTWNANKLVLYIDGQSPKADSSQVHFFKTAPSFPKKMKGVHIYLNDNTTWLVNPDWKTVYDELKIFNRVLSPAEIQAEYEKYFPSKRKLSQPFAKLPALLPICNPMPKKNSPEMFATVKAVATEKSLILDFTVPNAGKHCNLTGRDSELWTNDSVEFHALGEDGKTRQFIVNPKGALYDSLAGNAKWNSNAKVSAKKMNGKWIAKLEIPLEDLNAGKELKVNFCVSSPEGKHFSYTWSALAADSTGFADKRYFGTIRLDHGGKITGLTGIGNLKNGDLQIEYQASSACRAECIVTTGNGQKFKTLRKNLPSGNAELAFTLKDASGQKIYSFYRNFLVSPPLLMTVLGNCYSQTINCRLDFSASGLKQADGAIRLTSDGKEYLSRKFHSNRSTYDISLPIADNNLPDGKTYTVEAQVASFSLKKTFRYPDLTPFKAKVAVNHDVPTPWHPVKVNGQTVSVLDRTYHFEAGPLPTQAVSRGQKLIAAQPKFLLNGKTLHWGRVNIGKNWGDYVETSAVGSFDGGKVNLNGELWFDGMYKFTISLIPDAPLKLNSFMLCWAVPRDTAQYLLSPRFVPWKKDSISLKWQLTGKNGVASMIWLTGPVNGFAWSCMSNANWITDPNRDNIHIVRKDRYAEVKINILAKAAVLRKPADYTMVFQATPPKHPDHSFREITMGARWQPKSDYVEIGGHSWDGPVTPEHIVGVVSMVPADFAKFRKSMQELHAKGFKTKMYGMPTHMGKPDPYYDYLFLGCSTMPGFAWEAKDPFSGEQYLIEPCCGNTPVSDVHAWNLDRLYREVPELDGCYFDIMSSFVCQNPNHGCSGIDAFGNTYSTINLLAIRSHALRILKIHQKYGRSFGVHAHNQYYPFVHDLGDYWMPGEELYSAIVANPEWGYLETTSPEAFQSAWNSEIRGMAIHSQLQFTRITRIIKMPKEEKKKLFSDEYFIHGIAPSLLYDYSLNAFGADPLKSPLFKLWEIQKQIHLAKAQFHGYWTEPVTKKAAASIKVSWYSWEKAVPHSRMFCVVNINRNPVKTGLKFAWDKIGISAPSKLKDIWSGKSFTAAELASFELKGHNFMLLVPEK